MIESMIPRTNLRLWRTVWLLIPTRWGAAGGAVFAVAGALGCSGSPPGEVTQTQREALIGGATNVTDGNVAGSNRESETSTDSVGSKVLVAYNRGDTAHEPSGQFCIGDIGEGIAYSDTNQGAGIGQWTTAALPLPPDVAVILGDPQVAAVPTSASAPRFYISALTVSTNRFYSMVAQTYGNNSFSQCLPDSAWGDSLPDGVWVWTANFDANGNLSLNYDYGVTPASASDSVDGTDMLVIGTTPYVTYRNVTQNTAEVFQVTTRLPSVPLSVADHPMFPKGAPPGPLWVVAPDGTGTFYGTRYYQGGWHDVSNIATAGSNGTSIQLSTGASGGFAQFRSGVPYTAAWSQTGPMAARNLVFFYQKGSGGQLQGVQCTVASSGLLCSAIPGWTTDVAANSFMPSLSTESYYPPGAFYPTIQTWLSYWTDGETGWSGLSDGNAKMILASLDLIGGTMSQVWANAPSSQMPCARPDSNGGAAYWGDYDTSTFVNNKTTNPTWVRTFTDSTDSTCDPTTGNPQHVSMVSLAAPSPCGILGPNQAILNGQSLFSCDGRFSLSMTSGNLVLSFQGSTLWQTGTSSGSYAIMQAVDGNFVVYDMNTNPVWATNWYPSWYAVPGASLSVGTDGNLVIYDPQGQSEVWASNTCCY